MREEGRRRGGTQCAHKGNHFVDFVVYDVIVNGEGGGGELRECSSCIQLHV